MLASFKENATRLSRLMHDELMPSKDIDIYWIEHGLRNKGAKHLQLIGKDMFFYQRNLLHVIAFLIVAPLIIAISFTAITWWQVSKYINLSKTKVKRS